ncbi:unnamed protein product, partial [Cuscuta campestris]
MAEESGLKVTDQEIWFELVGSFDQKNRIKGVGDLAEQMKPLKPRYQGRRKSASDILEIERLRAENKVMKARLDNIEFTVAEQIQRMCGGNLPTPRDPDVDALCGVGKQIKRVETPIVRYMWETSSRRVLACPRIFLGCGKPGHFRRNCPTNPGKPFPTAPVVSQSASARPAPSQRSTARSNPAKNQSQQQGRAPARTYAMKARAEENPDVIQGMFSLFDSVMHVLIDPGSTLSYICVPIPDKADIMKEQLEQPILVSNPLGHSM